MNRRFHFFLFFSVLTFCFSASSRAEEQGFFSSAKVRLIFDVYLPKTGSDFSGVNYVPSKARYLIIDDHCKIFEVAVKDNRPENLRTVRLKGLRDCEAITHLPFQSERGMIRIAIAEEGKGTFSLFDLRDGVTSINRTEMQIFLVAKMGTFLKDNTGLEAMAAEEMSPQDPPLFYFGKEEFPRVLYRGVLKDGKDLKVEIPWDAEQKLPASSDIAELFLLDGKLFVLDQRGSKIRQVNPQTGNILSEFQLPIPTKWGERFEGISIFRKQAGLYQMMIVGEKNRILFYEIRKA